MKFFEELKGIIGDKTVVISITADGERLIVVSLPKDKNDEPLTGFVPLCMSGTPDQLEAGFMNSLAKSVEVLNGLKSNLDAVEKSKVEASSKTTIPSTKKGKGKKDEKASDTKEEPSGTEGLPFSDATDEEADNVFDDVDQETGEIPVITQAESQPQNKSAQSPAPTPKPPAPKAPPVAAAQQTMQMPESPAANNDQPINEASDEW
jgi:PRTRC genetic system protein E